MNIIPTEQEITITFKSDTIRINKNGCWEWRYAKGGQMKYGQLYIGDKKEYCHRASFKLLVAKIPYKMQVLHKCDNPPCFNPSHLFIGSLQDNMNDMVKKGRQKTIPLLGIKNGMCKFSEETIRNIRKDKLNGMTPKELRNKYNIKHAQLWRITSGTKRKEVI